MMRQSPTPDEDIRGRLAANMRRLRVARHLSLSQLARDTSTSKATLSAIERGRGNPTVDTLSLLAGALRVSIAELLTEPPAGEMRIVRSSQAAPWPPTDIGWRLLEEVLELRGNLALAELTLPPECTHAPQVRPSGSRAAVLVLRGKLIAGPAERISELAGGDYASFPTDAPCVYETRRGPARALLIEHTPA
jgi:transcriptional regulator with XRE-family HTH domain